MNLMFSHLQRDFWAGTSNLDIFLDCPYLMEGGFVLLCTAGEAKISVGVQHFNIKKNADMIILPSTTFYLISSSEDFSCSLFAFSKEVYDESSLRLGIDFPSFLYENPFVIHLDNSDQIRNASTWMDMAGIFQQHRETQFWPLMYRNFIQGYLIYLYNEIQDHLKEINNKLTRKEVLFHKFISLLDTYCRDYRDVAFYADKLHMTTRYLWMITDECSAGESPKEIIDRRFVLEIKVLLQSTNLSIQEISQNLQFPNQSYLGRYFKRHTGTSPSSYRKKVLRSNKNN